VRERWRTSRASIPRWRVAGCWQRGSEVIVWPRPREQIRGCAHRLGSFLRLDFFSRCLAAGDRSFWLVACSFEPILCLGFV
jgi:hypothetical protein